MIAHLAGYLEASAARFPDRVAVVAPDGASLTFRDLDDRASRVAGFLRASGVAPGDRVALMLPKGLASIIVIFGALKARAAYVPIDWSGPPARNAQILAGSGATTLFADPKPLAALASLDPASVPRTVITVGNHASWEEVIAHTPITDATRSERSIDDVAYILFTSGSTGVPKGVTLTHDNATSFVDWCSDVFSPTPEDRFSSHAPFHFDLSVLDIYVPIKHASTLFIVSEDLGQSPKKLAAFIREKKLTVWYSAPSILSLLTQFGGLDTAADNDLRLVLFAGEVFPVKHLRRLTELWPRAAYYNLYGPTETNVCTFARIPLPIPADRVEPYPIGPACAHCDAMVLDDVDGAETKQGGLGLLYIAGRSVFREYWGRPDLTSTAFIERAGKRWYNTGDVVREDADQGFIYAGRRDRMVKRRGHRIELGEIERALYTFDRALEVAVVAVPEPDAGMKITAYLALQPGARASIIEMKQFCSKALPTSMSPDVFVFLEALPRTSTDKTDYQALTRLASGHA